MASGSDIKKRITTVKNTQQTTRAMKMVSAAKLRRAQEAIMSHRPYAKGVDRLIRLVSSAVDITQVSPLLYPDSTKPAKNANILLLVITSDRGLCGGFNGNIIKVAQRWINQNQDRFGKLSIGFIGRKGHDFFKYRNYEAAYYSEYGRKAEFAAASAFTSWAIDEFTSGRIDEIRVAYNEFKNAVVQKPLVEKFLPVLRSEFDHSMDEIETVPETIDFEVNPDLYLMKPEAKTLVEKLIEKHFSMQLFRMLLESQASEHGARMSAMDNATSNAGEMIRKLTLQFNKQRQAGITKELLEIIAGSESQKN